MANSIPPASQETSVSIYETPLGAEFSPELKEMARAAINAGPGGVPASPPASPSPSAEESPPNP